MKKLVIIPLIIVSSILACGFPLPTVGPANAVSTVNIKTAIAGTQTAVQAQSIPTKELVAATLSCDECIAEGISDANIFSSPNLSSLACKVPWGTQVFILDSSTNNDVVIYKIRTPGCDGWVSSRLVKTP